MKDKVKELIIEDIEMTNIVKRVTRVRHLKGTKYCVTICLDEQEVSNVVEIDCEDKVDDQCIGCEDSPHCLKENLWGEQWLKQKKVSEDTI